MDIKQPYEPRTCSLSLEDALFDLKQALAAEERSLEAYDFLATVLADQDDQDLVRGIAEDEERHIAIVNSLIAALEKHYHPAA